MKNKSLKMTEKQERILKEYLEELKLKQKSTKSNKGAVKQYFGYLNNTGRDYLEIKTTDAADYQEYLAMLLTEGGKNKYSSVTVSRKIVSLVSFYDYLKREGKVFINPFREIKRVRTGRKLPDNILNEEEINLLFKSLADFNNEKDLFFRRRKYRAHLIAELMYSTGLRINEVAKIKMNDIDFIRGVVKVTDSKSNQERTVFLNSYTERILRIYIENLRKYYPVFGKNWQEKYLFGTTYYRLTLLVNEVLERETEKLKLNKITSHKIRHAFGVHFLRSGCDIRYIQELLGHKDIKNTEIYTKIDTTDLKNVLDKFHPRKIRRLKDEAG